jgi:hypothetical protein
MRTAEAAQDFQKAVEADPHSVKAQRSLGVIYLFQYQNGLAEQLDRMDDPSSGPRRLTTEEVAAKRQWSCVCALSTRSGVNTPRTMFPL